MIELTVIGFGLLTLGVGLVVFVQDRIDRKRREHVKALTKRTLELRIRIADDFVVFQATADELMDILTWGACQDNWFDLVNGGLPSIQPAPDVKVLFEARIVHGGTK